MNLITGILSVILRETQYTIEALLFKKIAIENIQEVRL